MLYLGWEYSLVVVRFLAAARRFLLVLAVTSKTISTLTYPFPLLLMPLTSLFTVLGQHRNNTETNSIRLLVSETQNKVFVSGSRVYVVCARALDSCRHFVIQKRFVMQFVIF